VKLAVVTDHDKENIQDYRS